MKKALLLLVMILIVVPFVLGDTNTDFSRPYIQDKCYPGGTGDCYTDSSYLLRAVEPNTQVNISAASWDSCSVILGGSEFKGVPLSYYDPNNAYEHNSFLVLEESSVRQYGADCTLQDEYTFLGKAVSQLGVINAAYSANPLLNNMIYMAFVFNKTSDSNLYMEILTLNTETSKLELHHEEYVGTAADFGGYDDIMGVAGGSQFSELNIMPSYWAYFGFYSRQNDKLVYVTDQDDDGVIDDYLTILNITQYADDSQSHQLFFDDWNKDGYNEFILITIPTVSLSSTNTWRFELNYITPATTAPYYVKYSDTITVIPGSGGTFTPDEIYAPDGAITLCQVGSEDSPMEACISANRFKSSTGDYSSSSFLIYNNFNSIVASTGFTASGINYFVGFPPFSKRVSNIYYACLYARGTERYNCYGTGGTIAFYTTLSNDLMVNTTDNGITEVFIANIDGNVTDDEILLSNGDIEQFAVNTTAPDLGKWEATFTRDNNGRLYMQDISGDDKSELIYIDDSVLRMYSMNMTTWTYLNSSVYFTVTTTTISSSATTTTNIPVEQMLHNINSNGKTIFGLFIIFGLACLGAWIGRGNIILIVLGGIIGTALATMLTLISGSVLVIMIISLVLLTILGFTLFKPSGN